MIHCADLHLDSKLHTHLDRTRAKRRRDELLHNFERLAEYAAENAVEAVLIAGDLFDREPVSALTRNMVLSVICAHPEIRFYYLRGNHDTGDCLRSSRGADNLFLFGSRWTTYREGSGRESGQGRIAVTGIEPARGSEASVYASLHLDPDCFNIVMLHGQSFNFPALRNKGIDYLALGHLHAWKKAPLGSRGICCYPGCLEGRGFDESGPHGFALLEIDEHRGTMRHSFIPFARRTLYSLEVDVGGCLTTAQIGDLVENALRDCGCTAKDMADVILRGELPAECEKDIGYLRTGLEARFFFARLRDATTLRIDPGEYLYDESLRGEFVRTVMADASIPEEEKAEVIRCGFQAMDGEELLP